MTRLKKQRRMANKIVLDKTPKKQERLADPDSYESRKKRAQDKRKRHQSVFDKARENQTREQRDAEAGRRGTRHGGPLADKIRRLNQAARDEDDTASADKVDRDES